VQWDVLAEEASSDLAEAVLHQKEARIGINDPNCILSSRSGWTWVSVGRSTESEPVSLLVSSSARAAKRVVALTKIAPLQRARGSTANKVQGTHLQFKSND